MMQVLEYSYLKFTSLEKIVFWDYYTLSNKNYINSNFPIVKLSTVIKQRKKFIVINDQEMYKRCRVQIQGKGVILRDETTGKNIKTKKQQLCKTDDFLVAEIDAKVGGFGIVPAELDSAIVSGHYFLFEINKERLLPDFLALVVKQHDFLKQVKSTGSTNYAAIRPHHVLDYTIPLPPIQEQISLVQSYRNKIEIAEKLQQQANDLDNKLEIYFLDELGINVNDSKQKIKTVGLQFFSYSDLSKWGIDFVGLKSQENKIYKEVLIREISKISSGGTPSRNRKEYYENGTIPWIKTGELNNEIIFDTEEKITKEALKNSSARLYKKESIVIAMYGATIGKTAKLGIDSSTNQACAVLFDINNNIIVTDYLWEYLQTQTNNLKKLAYGSAQPNLNAGIISNIAIPIPSIEKQKEIVEKIISIKKEIKKLKKESIELKQEVDNQFKKTVFN